MSTHLGDLCGWKRVSAEKALLVEAQACDATNVAAVARLRRRWDGADVAIALDLVAARRRAVEKFADPERLLCDPQGVQQASSEAVAAWKAARFAGSRPIVDCCCGIGGDTMALARVGETLGIDRSDVRVWMAHHNANCPTEVSDVEALRPRGTLIHIDPARRDEARHQRTLAPEEHEPTLGVCLGLAAMSDGAAIKLGPGISPEVLPSTAEIEWISERGTLVQAVVWTGLLAQRPGQRRATMVSSGITRSTTVEPVPLRRDGEFGRWLFVADPALERSGLLGRLARERGLAEPAPGLGIVTGEEDVDDPWLSAYEILERPRPDRRSVVAALRAHRASGARVRTRGKSADADRWTRDLRKDLAGDGQSPELDLFLLRLGASLRAIVCRRVR